MKKIILVTGSNKGLGLQIVRQLAALGHDVILTARNKKKGKSAAGKLGLNVHFHEMDVTKRQSIESAFRSIRKKFKNLDVLINNAGILLKEDNTVPASTDSIWKTTMDTNVRGPMLVAEIFLQMMGSGSRIINISSGGGSMSDEVAGWAPVYCVSKSALNALTRHMAHFLENRNISVNAVCPGWVKTDMGGRNAPRNVSEGADTPVWLATIREAPSGRFFRDRKEIPW